MSILSLALTHINSPTAVHESSWHSDDTSSNPDETARNFDSSSSWIPESGLDGPTVENITALTRSPANSPIVVPETSWESTENVSNPGEESPVLRDNPSGTPESVDGTDLDPSGVSSMTACSLFNNLFTDGRSWGSPPEGDSHDRVEGMKVNIFPRTPHGRTQWNSNNPTNSQPVCSRTPII